MQKWCICKLTPFPCCILYFPHSAWWRLTKRLEYYDGSAEWVGVYIECDEGFSPGVKDLTVARSLCHRHPLLCSWIASLPNACFSPALHSRLDTVEDLREMEGECPRGWWLHLYAVAHSYRTESGIGSPSGFVVTHILPIDCVEAARANVFCVCFCLRTQGLWACVCVGGNWQL